MHPLAPCAVAWVSPMTPKSAAEIKNIATFNSHTEALEPMAGATVTRYDASS